MDIHLVHILIEHVDTKSRKRRESFFFFFKKKLNNYLPRSGPYEPYKRNKLYLLEYQ